MEDRMMSAVCFTRCDVISTICWLLNDTFVVPSLHVHYTLLDVIPLRYHYPMHVRIYPALHIALLHMFFIQRARDGKYKVDIRTCKLTFLVHSK
jgi:hypothetical protein